MSTFASDEAGAAADPYVPKHDWPVAIAVSAGVFVFLGIVAGWVWSSVAVPAEYALYRPDYAYYASEAEFTRAFDMDVAFAVIGAVAALIGGLVVGWLFWSRGWAVTALAALAALGAAVIAWRLGIVLGPQSIADSAADAQRGDMFTGPIRLGARSILLIWPIVSLIGVIVVVWLRAPRDEIWYGREQKQGNPDEEVGVQRP